MTPYVRPLMASGFRVVAIDAPAHGRSPGGRTDIREIAAALGVVEQEIGPHWGVVAHSLGTIPLALALAEGRLSVGRAVCLAPAIRRDSLLSAFGWSLDLPEVVLANVARRLDAFTGPDFWKRLDIEVPTLLVHDAEDERIPLSDAECLEHEWLRARLVITHGLGHRGILSDPSVIREAVAFLQEGSAA